MNMELYISLAAMIISLISVIVSVAIYLLGIQRDKKQDTLDSFNLLQEQVFDKLNLITYSEITNICKKVDNGSIDDETNSKYYELLGYLARLLNQLFTRFASEIDQDKHRLRRILFDRVIDKLAFSFTIPGKAVLVKFVVVAFNRNNGTIRIFTEPF